MAPSASAARRVRGRHFYGVMALSGRRTKTDLSRTCLPERSRRALAVVRGSIIANLLENLATHITNAWMHLRHRLKRRSWENFRLKWSMYQSSPASRSRAS